MEVDFKQFE